MKPERPPFSPRGAGLVERCARVRPQNVAWLRYVLEAHEGLAFMHVPEDSSGSERVFLLAPEGLAAQLDELVADLLREGCLEQLVDIPVADG
jgi:hypothetical protein